MNLQENIRKVLMEESKGNFMKIKSIKVINGKNKWSESKDKLIHMVLDLGVYESRPSNKIEGFYERIKEHLPSLKSHRCSVGKIGGFLSRVKEGTWMGHIIEHVALELQTLAGMDTGWGRTRGVKGQEGVYNVVFNYEDEDKGKLAAREAFNFVNDIIENRDPHIDKIVKKLKPKKKIQETIKRILRETKEEKIRSFLFSRFDRVFNELNLVIQYDKQFVKTMYGKWFNEEEEELFHRNDWGILWVSDCDTYRKLRSYSSSLLLDKNEFKKLLIEYLNGKYSDQFNGKLIREIGDEHFCLDEDDYIEESVGDVLREEVKTKSTNKEFSKYKDSKFNTLRGYTLQDIVNNWDKLSNHKNDNIQTIKYFIDNPDKIDELIYDDKGLEDGYHRLIATKILKKPRFKYKLKDEEMSEMKEGELTEKCWVGYTQKGMKTMFGKRYPNCVKKTKK